MKYATEGDYLDALVNVVHDNNVEFSITKDKKAVHI